LAQVETMKDADARQKDERAYRFSRTLAGLALRAWSQSQSMPPIGPVRAWSGLRNPASIGLQPGAQ